MASTYTTRGRLEKQADGENDTTWGQKVNTVLDLLDEWRGGYESVDVAGSTDVTLTASDGVSDEVRQAVIELTGAITADINAIVPARENWWIIKNSATGSFTITVKTSSGTGVVVAQSGYAILYCDATNVVEVLQTSNFADVSNNLSDLASASTARTNLGLGTMATQNAGAVAITGGSVAGATMTAADNAFTLQDNGDDTKQLQFQLSGITTATTRTLTVPDADETIVGRATTDTLKNKTLDNTNTVTLKDANLTLQDYGDTTKQLQLELSGITTGTTRTLTVPDADTTLVGTDTTQTLTNKTISAAPSVAATGDISTSGGTVSDVNGDVRGFAINSQSTSYSLVASDKGKIVKTTAGVTVPASVFASGDAVTIINNSSSSITITQGTSVTLRQAGTTSTGNRTLGSFGMCSIACIGSDTFFIAGVGVS